MGVTIGTDTSGGSGMVDEAGTLVPPPRTQVTSDVGYDCDVERPLRAVFEQPKHLHCDGWWPDPCDDADGWRCACVCHERGGGWPGYERFVEASRPATD